MKLAIGTFLVLSMVTPFSQAQTNGSASPARAEAAEAAPADSYSVFNATPAQEAALRAQIRQIHPDVLPLRVFFVPHWKYLVAAREFHLHIPTGYGSLMFTHLPSRTVFIDNDRYMGEEWLGYWIAHEIGHLVTNSTKEEDAEKAAREFRKRLEDPRRWTCIQATIDGVVRNKRCGSYRMVGNPEVICPGSGLVMGSRLVGSDLGAGHRFSTDYGALGSWVSSDNVGVRLGLGNHN